MGRLALFSDAYLAASFAGGIPEGFAAAATATTEPLPAEEQLVLTSVQDLTPLADGRVAATVVIDDPADRLALGAGSQGVLTPNASRPVRAQLVMVRSGDRWLIDEIRPG